MLEKRRTWLRLAIVAFGTFASASLFAAESGSGAGGGSTTDSPYKNGPPPITGGYTDTTQGGKKGSGDMPAPPPGMGIPSNQNQDKGGSTSAAPLGWSPNGSQKDDKASGEKK